MSEDTVVEEQKPFNPIELLQGFSGAPSSDKIEEWKQTFGEVFLQGFSETELFILRPLQWKEHKDLQKKVATPVKEGEEPMTELDYQASVVNLCLLWTSVKLPIQKAGTIPTLFEMIMLNSNFVDPRVAAQFSCRL
jgi:hypothetical protein